MKKTFELNPISVQGAIFSARLFFDQVSAADEQGNIGIYARLETPFNNAAQEKTVWWEGNTQIPETALIPVIMNDVPTINAILSEFQFGGHLAGATLTLKDV